MSVLPNRLIKFLAIASAFFLATAIRGSTISPALAQGVAPVQPTPSVAAEPPFQLPFADSPGPDTWLLAQPYGNTVGAYYQRYTTYGASGGIHFGLDLAAPCGTEIVAIADGLVFAVDGPFGSPPHNLMIDHPELGYASMYGHLLEAPSLTPGQKVKQGEVIAKVGDSRGDCNMSPHLHLEIRDLKHFRKFNPANLIEADWQNLALYGSAGRGFMHDLAEPRKWQMMYDQPEAQTGGPIVNDFEWTWPLDWDRPPVESRPAAARPTPTALPATPTATPVPPPLPPDPVAAPLPAVRQITTGDCCTDPFWSADSTEVRFIDRPAAAAPVGVWGIDVNRPQSPPQLVTERLGVYSPDGALLAYPDRAQGVVVVERLADGQQWTVDTGGESVSFTPDGRLLWTAYDAEVPWRARRSDIWLAESDGSRARVLATLQRGGPVAWLSDDELLISRRVPPEQDTLLAVLSLEEGTVTELVQLPRARDVALSPDKRTLVYLVRHNSGGNETGLWLLDLQAPELKPEKLPFFGAYRWRDNRRLVYVPFDPQAAGLNFYEYDVLSGQTRPLFPSAGQPLDLEVANNDWQVSPDGSKIALVAAGGTELNGIWVIDLGED